MGNAIYDEKIPINQYATLVPGDTIAWSPAIFPDWTGTWRIDQAWATNNDTIDHVVEVIMGNDSLTPGAGSLWFSCNVPAGSGIDGVAPVDLFSILGPASNPGVALPPTIGLLIRTTVTLNSGKLIGVHAIGGSL